MSVADRPVVGAPVGHHRVYIGERTFSCEGGHKPGGGPGLVGSLIERFMYILGDGYGVSFSELQYRTDPFHQVDPRHGHRHPPFGEVLR